MDGRMSPVGEKSRAIGAPVLMSGIVAAMLLAAGPFPISVPPAAYRSGLPLAKVSVAFLPWRRLQNTCHDGSHSPDYVFDACTYLNSRSCKIYINSDFRGTRWEKPLYEHELAHCRGWRHRHK